jgi:hypothetical protein
MISYDVTELRQTWFLLGFCVGMLICLGLDTLLS